MAYELCTCFMLTIIFIDVLIFVVLVGSTPLHYASSGYIVRLLLERGANIKAQESEVSEAIYMYLYVYIHVYVCIHFFMNIRLLMHR